MNGLTPFELDELAAIRRLVQSDLGAAKKRASAWMRANKRRRGLREAATRTIKGLRSWPLPTTPTDGETK